MSMTESSMTLGRIDSRYSPMEIQEMRLLGILTDQGDIITRPSPPPQVPRRAVTSHDVLNEAYDYEKPSSFSRGLVVNVQSGQDIVWLSGTASIDGAGETVCLGDFRAQTWRTLRNLTRLLESENAGWRDIVRTSCYLRDIERDYDDFNQIRTLFFQCFEVDPVPASTGIQARLCRSDLLIEIEAFAFLART